MTTLHTAPRPAVAPPPVRRRRRGRVLSIYLPLFAYLTFTLVPLYWMLVYALREPGSRLFTPFPLSWENFEAVLDSLNFATFLRNSAVIGIGTVVLSVLFALMGGYALARFRFRGRRTFLVLLLCTQFVPGAMLLIPLYEVFRDLGLLNSLQGLIVANTVFQLPLAMILMSGFIRSVPVEWANVFERDCERASALYRRLNLSPAGAGMLTGSDVPVDRERTARLLGFDGPIPHTMDAILSHDTDCLETAAVLGIVTANLGRFADDVQLWFSAEFGYVDFPDRFCGTSSIMPQKRNPDFPEATKSVAVLAASGLTSAFLAEKGPTGLSFRERRVTDDTLDRAFTLAIGQLAATSTVLRDVAVETDRTLAVAAAGWAQATDLATALTRHADLPWRSAHQIVGILVRLCSERGFRPDDVTPRLVDEAAVAYLGRPVDLPEVALRDALDPREGVERRTLLGGPAPRALRAALAPLQQRLNRDQDELTDARDHLTRTATDLEEAIDHILTHQ